MSRSDDLLLPVRGWDELIAASTRRGERLRRRRRLVVASPLLTLGVLAASLPAADMVRISGGPDRVVIQPADRDGRPVPPTEELDPPRNSAAPGAAAGGRPQPAARPAEPANGRAVAPAAAPAAPPAAAPVPAAAASPVVLAPSVVVVEDPRGDGAPSAGTGIAVTSEPAHDILQLTFSAEAAGVRVRMLLDGDRRDESSYYAYAFTPAGCEISLYLAPDGDQYGDGYFTRCDSDAYSPYFALPPVADPSRDALEAFLPYEQFPATIAPHESFERFRGETLVDGGVDGQRLMADIATGAGHLRGQQP